MAKIKSLKIKQVAAIVLLAALPVQFVFASEIPEAVLEEDPEVESWMTAPFETGLEVEMAMENWMTKPFEAAQNEFIALESWMTTPFEAGFEEALAVEPWMTSPFEAGDAPKERCDNYMCCKED